MPRLCCQGVIKFYDLCAACKDEAEAEAFDRWRDEQAAEQSAAEHEAECAERKRLGLPDPEPHPEAPF